MPVNASQLGMADYIQGTALIGIPAHSVFITFNHARHAADTDNGTLLNTQAKHITPAQYHGLLI